MFAWRRPRNFDPEEQNRRLVRRGFLIGELRLSYRESASRLPSRTTSPDESHQGYPGYGLFHGSSRLIRLWPKRQKGLTCRLAFSPLTCTERPTGTTNSSRQSSGIVLLPYSSVEICFLALRSRQFNSDMKILFKTILSQLSQESVMTWVNTIPTSSLSSVTTTHVAMRKTSSRQQAMASGTTSTHRRVSWGISRSMAL